MTNGDSLNAEKIAAAIMRGDADKDLEMIHTAYENRRAVVADKNLNTLRIGQRVKLLGLHPEVLNGNTGKITALPRDRRSKRFSVELDSEILLRGRVTKMANGIPVQCLEMIAD